MASMAVNSSWSPFPFKNVPAPLSNVDPRYVNVTNSDIKLKTGFVPKYVNLFKFATSSKTDLTYNKSLTLSISVLF